MTSAFGDQKVPMMTSINNVGKGWHTLIRNLEDQLNLLDENFGCLRYYADTQVDPVRVHFHALISTAEEMSEHICEECGEPGELYSSKHGWLKTLCAKHQAERLASQVHS
jgi:hypothetical protein